MTTSVLDDPLLTDSRSRLEVRKAAQSLLCAQENMFVALLREAEEDIKHQNFTIFHEFQRETLIRIQAQTALRKTVSEICRHVMHMRPAGVGNRRIR
jgi:DNA-directed RNA polymerase subunit L